MNIGGSLSVLVKNLPGFSIEGEASVNLTETDKKLVDRMTFSYEGDADIKLPGTYEEALKNWNKIQDVAEKNQRVISYTISPLERFCTLEVGILTEITGGNIEKVGMMMKDFDEASLLLKSFEKRQFTQENQGYLLLIQNLIQRYNTERNKLEEKVQYILPKIRKAEKAETELGSLLADYEKSPFKFTKIHRFLQTRETEINLIEFITQKADDLENVHKIVQGSGSYGGCALGNTYIVIYDLDVLPPNPISFIKQYEEANGELQENDNWKKPEELGKNKVLLDGLTRFATMNNNDATSICFIMRVNEYNSSAETNFRMKLLGKKSKVLLEEFEPPGEDDIFYRTNIMEHGLDHMTLKLNHFNVTQLRPILKVEVNEPGNLGWQETRNFTMELKTMETIIMLNRLKPNTLYSVNYKVDLYEREHPAPFEPECTAATGCIGSTGFKERYLSYFLTQPCSVPKELSCEATSENSIELTWELPNFIANDVTVDQFEYTLSQQKVDGRNNELICNDKTAERKVEFKNLSPASTYSFKVKYKGNDKTFELLDEKFVRHKIEGPDALILCSTLPSKLTGLKSLKVDPTKVTITWNLHQELVEGSSFLHYNVKAAKFSPDESEEPFIYKTMSNDYDYSVTGLDQGTIYTISVRVVSTEGSSLYSDELYIMTLSSPPNNLGCNPLSENSFEVFWELPMQIPPDKNVDQFDFELTDSEQLLISTDSTTDNQVTFTELSPASTNFFYVTYRGQKRPIQLPDQVLLQLEMKSPKVMITCLTLPDRLTGLTHSKVHPTEVTLSWNHYKSLAKGSSFLYYNVKATKLLNEENEAPLTFKTTNNENFVATGLKEGTSYSISARVVSTKGASLYSDSIIISTDSFGVQDKDRLLQMEKSFVS